MPHSPKDQYSAPPGTIADAIGRAWVYVQCPAGLKNGAVCGHFARYDPADLAERYGLGYGWDRLGRRHRCSKCGARSSRLWLIEPTTEAQKRGDVPRRL